MDKHLIYIVDDETDPRDILKAILNTVGYDNIQAYSRAKDAIEACRVQKPDLLITDVVMPEMDGYELTYIVKNDPELKDIKVMLLTALSTTLFVNIGRQSKADYYLMKPYLPDHLINTVKEALGDPTERKL